MTMSKLNRTLGQDKITTGLTLIGQGYFDQIGDPIPVDGDEWYVWKYLCLLRECENTPKNSDWESLYRDEFGDIEPNSDVDFHYQLAKQAMNAAVSKQRGMI
jgi:hypothetical protein